MAKKAGYGIRHGHVSGTWRSDALDSPLTGKERGHTSQGAFSALAALAERRREERHITHGETHDIRRMNAIEWAIELREVTALRSSPYLSAARQSLKILQHSNECVLDWKREWGGRAQKTPR